MQKRKLENSKILNGKAVCWVILLNYSIFLQYNYLCFVYFSSVEQEADEFEKPRQATSSTTFGEVLVLIACHYDIGD